ncbi:hypothetical protein PQC13_gp259 [Synechococcus phage S-SRM01]|uniref:Uncharacterized protein n=1 Tax=Synechococcus phage S-SRM01 TaxID=2781608 RepID=A0A879R211_9CAUD|nr:hypothetical protein PQC13_gp259 [Synechococcus phage S-SRM01]QPX48224.1 hypothetical protein [Synechococcus phage S-SRM01]
MKKHIAEDLPARKHPQAQMSAQTKKPEGDQKRPGGRDDAGGNKTPEERISQAASDIRYRARREDIPLRQAYSQYMQNSSMSEQEKSAVRDKLFGKGGMQSEDFTNYMKESASNAVSKALYKVFAEKKSEVIDSDQLKYGLEEKVNDTSEGKKYKVRVTDPKNNVTYVRYATRQKISELRGKGLEVEMTEYGTPYEGERTKGEKTAEVLGNRAKKDYDGDGKVESGAKEYRGAVHNAIQRKKGGVADGKDTSSVKEGFLGEVAATANLPQTDAPQIVNPDTNPTQIDFTTKKNKIVVNPTDNSQSKLMAHHEMKGDVILENGYSKFLKKVHALQEKAESEQQQKLFGLALSVKRGKTSRSEVSAEVLKIVDSMSEKEIRKFAKTKHEGIPKKVQKEETECGSEKENEVDRRPLATAINLAKNKARAMGDKNPIVMVASENIESGPILPGEKGKRVFPKGQEPKATGAKLPLQKAHYELEGEVLDEEMPKKAKKKPSEGTTTLSHMGIYGRKQKQKKTPLKRIFSDKTDDDGPDDNDPRNHPSLSARERNPNLR